MSECQETNLLHKGKIHIHCSIHFYLWPQPSMVCGPQKVGQEGMSPSDWKRFPTPVLGREVLAICSDSQCCCGDLLLCAKCPFSLFPVIKVLPCGLLSVCNLRLEGHSSMFSSELYFPPHILMVVVCDCALNTIRPSQPVQSSSGMKLWFDPALMLLWIKSNS